MILSPTEALTGLPSVRRHISRVIDDLSDHRNVLWFIPRVAAASSLLDSALTECRHRVSSQVERVVLAHSSQTTSGIAEFVGRELGLQRPTRLGHTWDAESIVSHVSSPDILVLDAATRTGYADSRSEGLTHQLERFCDEWMKACDQWRSERDAIRLLLLVTHLPMEMPVPALTSVRASSRHYWGVLSPLDIRCVAEAFSAESGAPERQFAWAEAVYAEVAGHDVSLLAILLDAAPDTGDELNGLLQDYGRRLGWNSVSLSSLLPDAACGGSASPILSAESTPPNQLRQAWLSGVVSCLRWWGIETHSSAVALLGQWQVLDHRVWRGQARVLMPLLDAVRITLCARLTKYLGPRWPDICPPRDSSVVHGEVDDPTTEWGHLLAIWRSSEVQRRRLGVPADDVRELWASRNCLAHHDYLARTSFERVFRIASMHRSDALS